MFRAESAVAVQMAQQQRAAAALAQRLQAACVTIAEHEMAAADFKRYFQELQDRTAQLGEPQPLTRGSRRLNLPNCTPSRRPQATCHACLGPADAGVCSSSSLGVCARSTMRTAKGNLG